MKFIDLAKQALDSTDVLTLAQTRPVVLLAADGREYMIAEADDFEQEVEQLRNSLAFQQFLDQRSGHQGTKRRISLDDVERTIDAELARQHDSE